MIKREFFKKIHDFVLLHRGITCVALILLSFLIAFMLVAFKPRAKKKPYTKMKVRVSVVEIKKDKYRVELFAMGEVKAKREIKLFPQISGKVSKINPAYDEGALVKKGDVLLEIENADYKSKFDLAKASYEKEEGLQGVAKQEYDFITTQVQNNNQPNSYLALRGPELKQAKANLDMAKLNLDRTVIAAPFDAIVLNKSVDLGQYITPQTMIAELKSSDVFRIEALIPVSKLKWLAGYEKDPLVGKALVYHSSSGKRSGEVIRVLDALKNKSHMGRVLIEINNPLESTKESSNPLFLESFVDVEISGIEISDVYRIERSCLHPGDIVWFEDNLKLGIKKVNVVYRDKNYVYFKDEDSSIKLIVSNIATPVPGIELKVMGEKNE